MVKHAPHTPVRTGARSRADIAPARLEALNRGEVATTTLVECLAMDHAELLRAVVPELPDSAVAELAGLAGAGITRRMAAAAELLLAHLGEGGSGRLTGHPADTARGWAAFMIGRLPDLSLAQRLALVRPLADDPHFGVREWAWLGLRPHIAADIRAAIALLSPWTAEASPNLRRFAVESTRPRGVWATHIAVLKQEPALGLPLLEPLRADPATYVQDSVANWLNDAAKDQPNWVRQLCARWQAESPLPVTRRLCGRAVRSLTDRDQGKV
ncbi:MAG: DNA alkylation repair protein [Desulfobulbaceae bacterium A2]|nr:MAG: DNA alkylation repair protein [Desulfobulbaceae bacterium A2]